MRADAREVDRKGQAQSKVIIKEGLHVIQSPSKRYMVPVCVSSQEASTVPLQPAIFLPKNCRLNK